MVSIDKHTGLGGKGIIPIHQSTELFQLAFVHCQSEIVIRSQIGQIFIEKFSLSETPHFFQGFEFILIHLLLHPLYPGKQCLHLQSHGGAFISIH